MIFFQWPAVVIFSEEVDVVFRYQKLLPDAENAVDDAVVLSPPILIQFSYQFCSHNLFNVVIENVKVPVIFHDMASTFRKRNRIKLTLVQLTIMNTFRISWLREWRDQTATGWNDDSSEWVVVQWNNGRRNYTKSFGNIKKIKSEENLEKENNSWHKLQT